MATVIGQPPRRVLEAGATSKQTAPAGLEAPRLQTMYIADVVRFEKKRQINEDVVFEKNKEEGVNIALALYKRSVDRNVLRMIWRAEWIRADSVGDVTDQMIKECIGKKSKRPVDELKGKKIDSW